jgi:TRAP-type uncharacterized transport system substrate-binding protein
MEPLPRGSNFKRAKMLWEIGVAVAGDPRTPYGGDRDLCITVGNGSGERFRPALRMATGSPILATSVASGELDMAMVNPSAFLTQAVRGVGFFDEPLPLRVVAVYPTWDWFAMAIHPRTELTSLRQVKERRYPLRLSAREDATHSTRIILDQILALHGFGLDDVLSWGGRLDLVGAPGDPRRLQALDRGDLDAILDEGVVHWFDHALRSGMRPLDFDAEALTRLGAIGWRHERLPADQFKNLTGDYTALNYSGWPIYARAEFSERLVYEACAAIVARKDQIPWEDTGFTGDLGQLGRDTFSTPIDVPLHPGAERFWREHEARPR